MDKEMFVTSPYPKQRIIRLADLNYPSGFSGFGGGSSCAKLNGVDRLMVEPIRPKTIANAIANFLISSPPFSNA